MDTVNINNSDIQPTTYALSKPKSCVVATIGSIALLAVASAFAYGTYLVTNDIFSQNRNVFLYISEHFVSAIGIITTLSFGYFSFMALISPALVALELDEAPKNVDPVIRLLFCTEQPSIQ